MRGSNGGGSFKIEHGSDAAEITNLHKAGAEFGEVVGEKETRIKRKPRLRTRAAASIWFEIWGVVDPGKKSIFPGKFPKNFDFCSCNFTKQFRFLEANFRKVSIFQAI